MNIDREPSYDDMQAFTGGKFECMSDEDRRRAYDEYMEAYDKHMRLLEHRRRECSWERFCPPGYRNTIPEQLPNLAKFKQVQEWQYGATGLLLVGPTRRGKTRAAWTLIKRLYLEEGRTLEAFRPMDLKLKVANAWADAEGAEEWILRLRHTNVLFLDDLDTVK